MQIQINTDHNIEGSEMLSAHISKVVEHALNHHSKDISRVEVHVSDENGPKSEPQNIRCAMEARMKGHQPVIVTFESTSIHQAINGTAKKLGHLVEHTLGRLHDNSRNRTDPSLESTV